MMLRVTTAFAAFVTTLAGGVIVSPAQAQPADRDPHALFAQADANGDGDVAWQEIIDMRTAMFGRLDRNGDGVVDASDRPRPARFGKRFDEGFTNLKNQFDADEDGRVARAEMIEAPSPAFEAADANSDGVLDADELAAVRSASDAE